MSLLWLWTLQMKALWTGKHCSHPLLYPQLLASLMQVPFLKLCCLKMSPNLTHLPRDPDFGAGDLGGLSGFIRVIILRKLCRGR